MPKAHGTDLSVFASVGFTGTRNTPTKPQLVSLYQILGSSTGRSFHHGECIGADTEAHHIASRGGWLVHVHPSNIAGTQGDYPDPYDLHGPLPPLRRNRIIVDSSNVLIAVPHGVEELRSGTWATVRYARKLGRPILIIRPDGRIESE